MVVEGDVFKFEILLIAVLVDEGGIQLAFPLGAEALDLDLFGKRHPVCGDSLEYGFLGAPVDGELLVALVVIQVVNLFLRESLALDCREIPGKGLHVDSYIFVVIEDDGHVFLGMGDADIRHAVLEVGLAVVVMAQVDLLPEQFAKESPYRKAPAKFHENR